MLETKDVPGFAFQYKYLHKQPKSSSLTLNHSAAALGDPSGVSLWVRIP